LCQEHPSGLHDVLVNPLALPSAFVLPAMNGAFFVEAKSSNDGLYRTTVCQQGHDGGDQLMRLMHSIERGTLGGRESLAASLLQR
jgi:hypothetical protein